jgi:hypothetical protein
MGQFTYSRTGPKSFMRGWAGNKPKSRRMIQSRLSVMDARKPVDAQAIAIDAVVALTDGNREMVTDLIQRLYLTGVRDPKRLTFKGLQAISQA